MQLGYGAEVPVIGGTGASGLRFTLCVHNHLLVALFSAACSDVDKICLFFAYTSSMVQEERHRVYMPFQRRNGWAVLGVAVFTWHRGGRL